VVIDGILTLLKYALIAAMVAAVIAIATTVVATGLSVPNLLNAMLTSGATDGARWAYKDLLYDASTGGFRVGTILAAVSGTLVTGAVAVGAYRLFKALVKV